MTKMSKYSRIIAFAGRKRSGKSMLARGMKEYSSKVVIVTIADNLKFLCCKLLNRTYDELNQMKDDGSTFEEKVDEYWIRTINKETGIDKDIIVKEIGEMVFTNVRDVLQIIGTDLIRKYVPEWHIDKTINRIKSYGDDKIIVVDDVRFPNEKRKIEGLGGDVFFVIRPNCWDVSNHMSETALSYEDFAPNCVIINEYSKEDMVEYFNLIYFNGELVNDEEYPIFLSANPWYMDTVMEMNPLDEEGNALHRATIKMVIEKNKTSLPFMKKGIITFKSNDDKSMSAFRRFIMNESYNIKWTNAISWYNPLTNEMLKKFM